MAKTIDSKMVIYENEVKCFSQQVNRSNAFELLFSIYLLDRENEKKENQRLHSTIK